VIGLDCFHRGKTGVLPQIERAILIEGDEFVFCSAWEFTSRP